MRLATPEAAAAAASDLPPVAAVDPVTLEIIRHTLGSIADEIEVDITRTAYSPLIYEYRDYAVGLLDPDGQLMTHAERGPLIFTADLDLPLRDCLQALATDNVKLGPSDVVLNNHAGICGQHLNNVNAYSPAYVDGELIGYAAIRMHWADVGGKEPGSTANDSTSIFQEGFTVRAARIMVAGEWNRELLRIVESNTRLPEQVLGDLKSQVFAAVKGARLLSDLARRYGAATVKAAVHRIWDESEQLARQVIAQIPDGVYEAESWLDDDGVEDAIVPIPIKVTISGSTVTIDFQRIADQLKGPFNSGNGAATAARNAFKYILGSARRADAGVFRPLKVITRPRSFLTAEFPAPLARWSAPLPTVADTIIRAFSQAVPERAAAGHHGSTGAYYFYGYDSQNRFYKHMDAAPGGWGALSTEDGPGPYKTLNHGDSADIPIEVVERTYPIQVLSYRFKPDSGGRGKWRGGLATEKRFLTSKSVLFSCMFDRAKCVAWGLYGGEPGISGGVMIKRPDGSEQFVRKTPTLELPAGTEVIVSSGGGGGWGPTAERDVSAIERDIRFGYVTPEAACSADHSASHPSSTDGKNKR